MLATARCSPCARRYHWLTSPLIEPPPACKELISIEIIDESDVVTDNISRKRVAMSGTQQRRIEFFEMLQRRELLTTERLISNDSHIGGERPSADEVRALASYLSNNVVAFRPPNMSFPMLRRLLLRCSISRLDTEQVETGRYVYVRGVPASFCCLVLHGRLQIRAGNEGFTSEIGPWTMLALQALTDVNYQPDFTARVECAARILIITRQEVHALLGIASPVGHRAEAPVEPEGAAEKSEHGAVQSLMHESMSGGNSIRPPPAVFKDGRSMLASVAAPTPHRGYSPVGHRTPGSPGPAAAPTPSLQQHGVTSLCAAEGPVAMRVGTTPSTGGSPPGAVAGGATGGLEGLIGAGYSEVSRGSLEAASPFELSRPLEREHRSDSVP